MNYSETIIFVMEITGTVAFASSGAMLAVRKEMDLFGVCVLGVTASVGGGLMRDLILGITTESRLSGKKILTYWMLYRKKT